MARDEWADDQSDLRPVDFLSNLEDLATRLAEVSPMAVAAVAHLSEDKCDRVRVLSLLSSLEGSQMWVGGLVFHQPENPEKNAVKPKPLTKAALTRAATRLAQAATIARQLQFGAAGPAIFGTAPLNLDKQLFAVSQRAARLAEILDARQPLFRSLVKAALVRFVKVTTGQFHDHDLAVLIDAVEGLRDETGQKPIGRRSYTSEAHRAWRRRSASGRLMNNPSAWDEAWLRSMEWLDTWRKRQATRRRATGQVVERPMEEARTKGAAFIARRGKPRR